MTLVPKDLHLCDLMNLNLMLFFKFCDMWEKKKTAYRPLWVYMPGLEKSFAR